MNKERERMLMEYELVLRSARNRLFHFIHAVNLQYVANWHHKLIADKIDKFLKDDKQSKMMVFVPPQHGKSQITSRSLPAYLLGQNPSCKIAIASYSSDLAGRFNSNAQDIMSSDAYKAIFPNTVLIRKTLEECETAEGGGIKAVGVTGPLTGNTVDVAIIDDPVKDDIEASSTTYRERVWQWYLSVIETRLHNKSKVILILCMSGETQVLMADGSEKFLKDIKIGDSIATYENGKLSESTVKNWVNQGTDQVFEIKTNSGTIVKANERHPFLVSRNNKELWIRVKNLKKGDKVIRVRAGEHIEEWNVRLKNAQSRQNAEGTVRTIMVKKCGQVGTNTHQTISKHTGNGASKIGTESQPGNMRNLCLNKMDGAPYAVSYQEKTLGRTGEENSVLTTTTLREKYVDCSAMTATSQLDMQRQRKFYSRPLTTYEITLDEIIDIRPAGHEDVFDIQVDRTENFIANGLVSHNTRWHEEDLAGRLLNMQPDNWQVISIPAIREDMDNPDDPRAIGEPLWPERHSLERLNDLRAMSEVTFSSLYQQRPAPAEGNKVKRAWWTYCDEKELPGGISWDIWIDGAYTNQTQNDPTGLMVAGHHKPTNVLYIKNAHDARLEMPELLKFIDEYAFLHGIGPKSSVFLEPKASGKNLKQMLVSSTTLNAIEIANHLVNEGKEARIQTASPKIAAGRVCLVKGAWNDRFVTQICTFPNSAHDEYVDLIGYACYYYFDQQGRKKGVTYRDFEEFIN